MSKVGSTAAKKSKKVKSVVSSQSSSSSNINNLPSDDDSADEGNDEAEVDEDFSLRKTAEDDLSDDEDEVPEASSSSSSAVRTAWNRRNVIDLTESEPIFATRTGERARTVNDLTPVFNGTRVGPNRIPNGCVQPSHFMDLFFTASLLDTFVSETNAFAAASQRRKWKLVTRSELKTLLAIVLFLGVIKLPSREMAWDVKYGQHFIIQLMTKTRFEGILSCLHWANAHGVAQSERSQRNKANSFWSVQGFLDQLGESCRDHYNPPQRTDVDESCFDFKGRHSARCYNPSKPAKWHFKAFCLNCSATGYMSNFFMYRGKDEQRPDGFSATEYPPIRLTDHRQYKDKNHIMATDNWYTSIKLALHLKERGIYLVGTIKANREGLPKDMIIKKTGPTSKARGYLHSSEGWFKDSKGMNHELFFTAWQDNKPVHMLSTFENYHSKVSRVQKDAKGNYLGPSDIVIPTDVMIYNNTMGGTDLFDQMVSYYKTRVRTRRWQTRIYFHFLNAMVVNAHILYKQVKTPVRGDDNFTLLSFMLSLISGWATPQLLVQQKVDGKYSKAKVRVYHQGVHTPVFKARVKNSETRKWCKCCKKHIASFCMECDVALCFGDGEGTESCWSKFHSSLVPL